MSSLHASNSSTRRLIGRILNFGDQHFDPDFDLLLLPITAYRNKHVEHLPKDALRHPLRESLYYALVLLASGQRNQVVRAELILSRIAALQERTDLTAPRYGLWSYFSEESVAAARTLDINWADFIGMGLCVAQARFGDLLSAETSQKMRQAIAAAAEFIRRRNVDLNYTNIAIKGTFVTLAAAELTANDNLLRYARDRLVRLHTLIDSQEVLTEYNSPAYAGVNLVGLHAMECIVRDSVARKDIAALLCRFWREVSDRFHPETGELAGPHARIYSPSLSRLPGWLGPMIEHVTAGKFKYDTDDANLFDSIWPLVLEINAPTETDLNLTRPTLSPHQVSSSTAPWPNEAPRVLTTYLESSFSLGSIAFQDGWEQHHNLVAYWRSRSAGGVAYLRHRYLHDSRPCCSGYFFSSQERGEVAVSTFLGAFADDHVMSPVEGVEAAFLGAVLEVDAAGESIAASLKRNPLAPRSTPRPWAVGDVLRIELAAVTIEVELTNHDSVQPARIDFVSEDKLQIIFPHYEGERRFMRWLDFHQAASGYRLRMTASRESWSRGAVMPPVFPPRVLPRMEVEAWATDRIRDKKAV